MAHPVRLQLVERLGRRGTARAADLADDMGIPANSVSYHLRILARGGVIAEAPEAARDRRDRVWKLSQSSYYAQPSEEDTQDPERKDSYQAASTALGLAALDWIRDAFVRHPAKGKGPGKGRMMSTSLHISHGQAEELGLALHELVDHYREMNRDAEGRDLEGDPDTDGEATDYRVMFALVADTEPSTRP
jgi:predicted ArsR family transcriptional regulator